MDKTHIIDAIIEAVTAARDKTVLAAIQARATAVDKENIAENMYDTLGLEAAYLAHGQSERAVTLEKELNAILALRDAQIKSTRRDPETIGLGSLVQLEDESGLVNFVFLAPASGGLKVTIDGIRITVVTPESPLGAALMHPDALDEVLLTLQGKTTCHTIIHSS